MATVGLRTTYDFFTSVGSEHSIWIKKKGEEGEMLSMLSFDRPAKSLGQRAAEEAPCCL